MTNNDKGIKCLDENHRDHSFFQVNNAICETNSRYFADWKTENLSDYLTALKINHCNASPSINNDKLDNPLGVNQLNPEY